MVRGTVPCLTAAARWSACSSSQRMAPAPDAARAAGAEYVGFDDMIKKCQEGWADFDVAVATPEAMGEVRKLGKVLGPRGLMPNPKTGTVTDDTAKAVREVKAGRVGIQDRQGRPTSMSPWARSVSQPLQIEEKCPLCDRGVLKAKPPGQGRTSDCTCPAP